MSNEAAERLLGRPASNIVIVETDGSRRSILYWPLTGEEIISLLAVERKATVERIRTAVHADTPKVPDIGTSIAAWLDAILDAEAASGA